MKLKCSVCGKALSTTSANNQLAMPHDTVVQAFCKKCKNLELACGKCGRPLIITNEYGIFCKDKCGLKEAKNHHRELEKMIEAFL